jgi:hypothetical protein
MAAEEAEEAVAVAAVDQRLIRTSRAKVPDSASASTRAQSVYSPSRAGPSRGNPPSTSRASCAVRNWSRSPRSSSLGARYDTVTRIEFRPT